MLAPIRWDSGAEHFRLKQNYKMLCLFIFYTFPDAKLFHTFAGNVLQKPDQAKAER